MLLNFNEERVVELLANELWKLKEKMNDKFWRISKVPLTKQIEHTLYNLRETVKDVGTRKLRQCFVDYVLEKQSEEI